MPSCCSLGSGGTENKLKSMFVILSGALGRWFRALNVSLQCTAFFYGYLVPETVSSEVRVRASGVASKAA